MLWQWVSHCPGLSASKSTSTVFMGATRTVSLRARNAPLPSRTAKVCPCRCMGWNIIELLMKRKRTRCPSRTGRPSRGS
ncbi:Uncharacterised protein [Mycobacteroides abscessus subsp. abscessus]|nr:Uncharacterised protein [Mycobacteroides abscessus subsp. abscessus]